MGIKCEWDQKSINRGNLNGNGKQPAWEWQLPRLLWALIPTDGCSVVDFNILCEV